MTLESETSNDLPGEEDMKTLKNLKKQLVKSEGSCCRLLDV